MKKKKHLFCCRPFNLVMANHFCFPWPLLLLLFGALPIVRPLFFDYNFTSSTVTQITQYLSFDGDASPSPNVGIEMTKNWRSQDVDSSAGRAVYRDKLRLWDSISGNIASFTTHFSFIISSYPNMSSGDGLAFFLAPYPATHIPADSSGENLGLFNDSANQVVAVEFDSFQNYFDPAGQHIGIDVYSIKSIATVSLVNFSISNGSNTAHATVTYDATAMNLTVLLSYTSEDPLVNGTIWNLSRVLDLRTYLPQIVAVGFSATTGLSAESHTILSWDLNWTDLVVIPPAPAPPPETQNGENKGRRTRLAKFLLGLVIGMGVLLCALGLAWFGLWQQWIKQRSNTAIEFSSIRSEFEQGRGPRSFRYQELAAATSNFAEEGKLGEGSFGAVYKGVLPDTNDLQVAIKKISKGSPQGKKEYLSEVTIFSQLRHRNLVQLIGYCHEGGEFLLVYQYMPNGSLDKHLYSADSLLGWPERHKIIVGLASALLYLQEEGEQCVVHRDIKPSNVLLDAEFNARLGDFGLARLVDHDCNAVTTVLAGTRGYMAPEYERTGKARKESDVYSFGVVALEIVCGRKPIDFMEMPNRVSLIHWVWELYERGACVYAADQRLNEEFDQQQMQQLMVTALWCAHPDYSLRPSIRRVVAVLCFDAPLPDLPPFNMPIPMPKQLGYASSSSSGVGHSSS